MTDLRAAAQQALEALEYHVEQTRPIHRTSEAIAALRAALAEAYENEAWNAYDKATAEPAEPVALDWLHKWANQDDGEPETDWDEGYEAARRVVQIHLTAPTPRRPLTEEEIYSLFRVAGSTGDFARAIERAHGITGDNK